MIVLDLLRAIGLMLSLMTTGLISAVLIVVLYPLLLIFDKDWVIPHRIVITSCWMVSKLWLTVEVKGLENIPESMKPGHSRSTGVIVVSNHQSTLDTFVLSNLRLLDFYVIFKRALLFYPGIGQALGLAGYLHVSRGDKESGRKLIKDACATLRRGIGLCWFPEGTRKIGGDTGPLGPFKPGAFVVAHDTGAPLLPVTISGARRAMPAKGLPRLLSGVKILLTIHKPVYPAEGKTVDQLSEECRKAIMSGLRDVDTIPLPSSSPKAEASTPVSQAAIESSSKKEL